ncbi:hypothetical protein MHYP_G00144380 [Metynnis hypsauchen]
MLVIFGILLMFTGASMGLLSMNPVCRFNQNDPCYGAVGRPLYLQLKSEYEFKLKINSGTPGDLIFRFKNKTITQNHSDPRWQFVTNNSTMIISSAEKRDSGRYILYAFDSAGNGRGLYHPQLVIEAVVSSVKVTDSCFELDKRRLSCSSDGDEVHYNWTFPHTHQLADGNQTLLLDREAVGIITCYAQNHSLLTQPQALLTDSLFSSPLFCSLHGSSCCPNKRKPPLKSLSLLSLLPCVHGSSKVWTSASPHCFIAQLPPVAKLIPDLDAPIAFLSWCPNDYSSTCLLLSTTALSKFVLQPCCSNYAIQIKTQGCSFISYLLNIAFLIPSLQHRLSLDEACISELHFWLFLLQHWNNISFFYEDAILVPEDL